MRRKEKEITERDRIEEILLRSPVCRLGMSDGKVPYVVPLSFGYKDNTLYFHSARKGKKLDILRRNNKVCFEADIDCEPKQGARPCEWGMFYKSVIGFGEAEFVEDPEAKRRALDIIMAHYAPDETFDYSPGKVKATTVIKVTIRSITGKQSR